MSIEIKTSTLEPVRNTFANLQRRFGDKPATRYQEATYDIQPLVNFHYRPLWDQDRELTDASRTALQMNDWYEFKDPRQFYYGTYVQQRAKMQENAENNYGFFEKRDLTRLLPETVKGQLIRFLVPLRHVEHTANLNNMYCSSYGFGTALTQAFLYNGMDRLGVAQYLSRIGLLLDGNTGEALEEAKQLWMEAPYWQPLRKLCEEMLTTEDWFELFIAQDVVMDSLVYDLFFEQYDAALTEQGAQDIGMLTEFMRDWAKDTNRWVDAVLKIAVAESDANKTLITGWIESWRGQVAEALSAVSREMLGEEALNMALQNLDKRLAKAGIK